jgi:hypothetical protein
MMPDVGAGACTRRHRLAPAGTRRHRLAGRPGWLDRPPAPAPASHGLRPGLPATGCGHGRTRTRQATATGRRDEAPARLRPELNKKAGNPEGEPARKGGRCLNAAAGWVW